MILHNPKMVSSRAVAGGGGNTYYIGMFCRQRVWFLTHLGVKFNRSQVESPN